MVTVNLKKQMEKKNVTMAELSREVGVSESVLRNLCTGKNESIKFDIIDKLCDYFKCTPNDILKLEYKIKEEEIIPENKLTKEVIDILVPEEILKMHIGDMIKDLNSEVICNDKVLTLATLINDKKVTLLIRKRNKEE